MSMALVYFTCSYMYRQNLIDLAIIESYCKTANQLGSSCSQPTIFSSNLVFWKSAQEGNRHFESYASVLDLLSPCNISYYCYITRCLYSGEVKIGIARQKSRDSMMKGLSMKLNRN